MVRHGRKTKPTSTAPQRQRRRVSGRDLPRRRPWPAQLPGGRAPARRLGLHCPDGTAETPAGGLSVVNADPTRIQHSYEVAASDELQMPGIGAALMASHLRNALMAGWTT